MDWVFLDTNVLVYAFTTDRRANRAEEILARGGTISVQVLNEFANVARRKLGMTWGEVASASGALQRLCGPVVGVDLDTHADALRLAERYGLSIFDASIVASALGTRCEILYTEDMQDGMLVDGRLRLMNPF